MVGDIVRLSAWQGKGYKVIGIDGDVVTVDHNGSPFPYRGYNDWVVVKTANTKPAKTKKAPKGPQAYKGNGKHTWESVDRTDDIVTTRLRVPGGWLYRVARNEFTKSVTFVPVPEVVGYSI
jgi:hypothetical protein